MTTCMFGVQYSEAAGQSERVEMRYLAKGGRADQVGLRNCKAAGTHLYSLCECMRYTASEPRQREPDLSSPPRPRARSRARPGSSFRSTSLRHLPVPNHDSTSTSSRSFTRTPYHFLPRQASQNLLLLLLEQRERRSSGTSLPSYPVAT